MSQKKTSENSTMTKKVQEQVKTESLSTPVAKKTAVKKDVVLAAVPTPAIVLAVAPVATATEPKKAKAVKKDVAVITLATSTPALAAVKLEAVFLNTTFVSFAAVLNSFTPAVALS